MAIVLVDVVCVCPYMSGRHGILAAIMLVFWWRQESNMRMLWPAACVSIWNGSDGKGRLSEGTEVWRAMEDGDREFWNHHSAMEAEAVSIWSWGVMRSKMLVRLRQRSIFVWQLPGLFVMQLYIYIYWYVEPQHFKTNDWWDIYIYIYIYMSMHMLCTYSTTCVV